MIEGWELKPLKAVCEKITDGTHQTPKYFDEGVIFLSSRNVTSGKINWDKVKYIDEKQHIAMHKRVAPRIGDILLAKNGTTGVGAIVDRDVVFDIYVSLAHIRVLDGILSSYMLYFINSPLAKKQFNKRLKGMGVPNLHLKEIREVLIPFPTSLKEQKQIVTTLDKAFKQIDQAKANLEKNLNNAKELFQSKLNEVFSQRGEGWEEKTLKEITTKIGSGSTPRGGQSSYKESGISLIRSMNVHDDGFREKKLAFIDDEQALKLKNVTLEKEDVLLNITGASVARCCIVPDNFLPARVNQHVSIIRLKENILHPSYLHYCLTAQENKNKLLNIGRQGATREAITKVQIENFIISYPKDMNRQLEVLEALHVIKEKSNLLEIHYQQKLNNLEDLKKSILQKAFKGELDYA